MGNRVSKYGNVKQTIDGITFDSKREAKRYAELKLLERAGEISGLELQVPVKLIGAGDKQLVSDKGRALRCTVDFRYYCNQRQAWIYEDAKGYASRDWPVRKAIMRAMGIQVIEV